LPYPSSTPVRMVSSSAAGIPEISIFMTQTTRRASRL
jgi:hypothetical protein